jgi:hypothetical protein
MLRCAMIRHGATSAAMAEAAPARYIQRVEEERGW